MNDRFPVPARVHDAHHPDVPPAALPIVRSGGGSGPPDPHEARERERALLRQRDLINGLIVHELANAVSVVGNTASLLRTSEPRSPHHQLALIQLRGAVQQLNEMIQGLRVLLDGDGEPPVCASGDLTAFVRSVVTDPVLIPETESRRVTLIARRIGARSVFSSGQLRHALGNLLLNALKTSPPESRVSVVVSSRGARQWIHVLNRGPKITTDMAIRLFAPGEKDAMTGMALGLHVTQICALRMGGELVFGSTGKATVFSLVWPVHAPATESWRPAHARESGCLPVSLPGRA